MVGEIKLYAGKNVPANWLKCDGKAYNPNSSTYSALFEVIGYRFGRKGGLVVDYFRVPNSEELSVSAHLEPEGDGTHEKVVTQTKADSLNPPKEMQYIIRYKDEVFTPQQEARIREIVHSIID